VIEQGSENLGFAIAVEVSHLDVIGALQCRIVCSLRA
jgi:hypothetical protein